MDQLTPIESLLVAIGIAPEWLPLVRALPEFSLAVAGVLVVAKPLAARAPAQWRPWLDAAFKLLDLVAVNTRGLHTRPAKADKK